ncbi:MAG: sulfurtransferase [Pseudonocardia sp.]|nr:sulfurtransferase [Pseudonocardia sp.]
MSPLISAADLARRLFDAPDGARPVVLDVRWRLGGPPAEPDYLAGHLPGARFVDLPTMLSAPPGPAGRHPLPDPVRLADELASVGVSDWSSVVCYDDADGSTAARAWWLLRWLGLPPDRVQVLDGGYLGWAEEGFPVSREMPAAAPGRLAPRSGSMPVLDAEDAADTARRGVLLDARAPERYLGASEPVDPRAGHIPGARNAPFARHVGPDGRWLAAERLAEHYRGLGVDDGARVGAYCGSGVTATSVVLALEYCGLLPPERPAALYAGSWSHWSSDPVRPAAVGPEPMAGPAEESR